MEISNEKLEEILKLIEPQEVELDFDLADLRGFQKCNLLFETDLGAIDCNVDLSADYSEDKGDYWTPGSIEMIDSDVYVVDFVVWEDETEVDLTPDQCKRVEQVIQNSVLCL